MYALLEIIHLTLVTIARGVFNSAFLIVIFLIYFMIKKTQNINIYGYKMPYQNSSQLIESILQGIIVGLFGSVIMTLIGLPIRITTSILFLLPIAIALALIHPRFLCFSYAASILCGLGLIFRGQNIYGIRVPTLDLDIHGLMVLVGILHLMEALLVFNVGGKYAIPIITKRDGKIMIGHILQRFWPIPFSLLALTLGTVTGDILQMPSWWPIVKPQVEMDAAYYYALLPIIGALGYKTVSFAYQPEKKAKVSAIRLMVYSVILVFLAILSSHYPFLKVIGILYMALAHEGIIQYDHYIESIKKPLYTLPNKGIRVLSVQPDGPAKRMGLEIGDIIHKINGVEIEDVKDYKLLMQNPLNFIWFEVEKLNGKKQVLELQNYYNEEMQLGFQPLPEKPAIIIKYESLNEFSIIHMIIKKLNKKI